MSPRPVNREWDPERPAVPLGQALDAVAKRLGMAGSRQLGAVFGSWADVVGDQVAAHARPTGLRDGVLVVRVDEPAWATQLRYLERDLLARLATAAGEGVVTRIEVRVEGPGERRKRPSDW